MLKKLLVACLALSLVACGGGNDDEVTAKYTAGTYEAEAQGMNGMVKVAVTVDAEKITAVEVLEHKETAGVSDPAIEQVPAAIVDAQGTENVEVVSGATITSNAIIAAVNDALTTAAAK